MSLNDTLVQITGNISDLMYSYLLVFLLVACAIYFTARTKGVQFRLLGDMFKQIGEKKHVEGEKSVSSFQAMMISTASRVGTGNIAGVAVAIAAGGPGAVFWMWLMALLGSATAFVESTLAQIWKVRGDEGEFRGGPAYYIQQALHSRAFGILFAIFLILCFALGFNGLQAYNMTSAIQYYFVEQDYKAIALVMGLATAAFFGFVVFGGSKLISTITSVLVPIMAFTYIGLALFVTITNIGLLPQVMSFIFTYAFDFQSLAGGLAGSMILLGIKRGLFSNEAGMGSAPNAAAAASVSHPVKQGLVQSLSVYIDTIIICSCTAFMVMVYYVKVAGAGIGGDAGLSGMTLVQYAIANEVGPMGIHFITFAIVCFAFSSMVGNYYYAESNIKFIKNDRIVLTVFRICCMLVILMGCMSSFDLAWNLADITMGLMAIENLIAIVVLGKWAFKALEDYEEQKKAGKDPIYLSEKFEAMGMPHAECWHVDAKHLEQLGGNTIKEYVDEALS